jgi:tetratricopeptide (TPR) repeat protein
MVYLNLDCLKMLDKSTKPAHSASSSPGRQTLTLQNALDLAMQHHTAGRLPLAERIYQQILQGDPNQPVALHLLGVIAHQAGKHNIAVDLITKSLAIKPDHAAAHNNLGNALVGLNKMDQAAVSFHKALTIAPDHAGAHIGLGITLLALGKPDEAVASYAKAITVMPNNAEAHNNLGNALLSLGKLDEAVASYAKAIDVKPNYAEARYNLGNAFQKLGKLDEAVASFHNALAIKPEYAEAHLSLGNALKDTGKLDAAVASYHKALAIAPDYAEAYYNLGNALRTQCKFEEAVQALQTASEKAPKNMLISNDLIDILNYHMPKPGTRGVHAKAQEALQRVIPSSFVTHKITDKAVRQLYQQCHSILSSHDLSGKNVIFQLYRGAMSDLECIRHFVVFDTFSIVPEYCFGCFKVSIAPRTVVELFKLMLIFDRLKLPNDNTRKCHVEVRPKISGAYKGVIYCRNLDEGKQISKTVKKIIGEKISKNIPVSVKRGCSEYPIVFPDFTQFEDDGTATMVYNEEWREHEDYTDKHLTRHIYPSEFKSHNHLGFTLRDVVIMRSWLAYAVAIGDLSYQKICKTPIRDVPIKKRPRFQPVKE